MKILHIVRQFHPCVGGIERFTLDLCRHTRRQGHECAVLTLDRDFASGRRLPAQETVEGMEVRRVPYFGPRRYRMAPTALAYLRGYDLLHIHCVDFFVDYLAATRWLHRRPMIVSTHGGFFHSPWGSGVKRLYFHVITKLALSLADRVVCDSPQDLALFSRIAEHRCQLIENGVDYESFAHIAKRLCPGLLLHVGRTDANKHVDKLLQATALVAAERPEVRLALVGPDWLGEWPRLQRVAADLGIAERVRFVGQVEEAELHRWLAEAHFFVSASAYEGFGIAAVEAMAAGTAPILNDIPAFRYLTQGGTCGLLADFDHPAAAAATIARALAMPPASYEDLANRARAAASRYSWLAVGEKFLTLYADVLRR